MKYLVILLLLSRTVLGHTLLNYKYLNELTSDHFRSQKNILNTQWKRDELSYPYPEGVVDGHNFEFNFLNDKFEGFSKESSLTIMDLLYSFSFLDHRATLGLKHSTLNFGNTEHSLVSPYLSFEKLFQNNAYLKLTYEAGKLAQSVLNISPLQESTNFKSIQLNYSFYWFEQLKSSIVFKQEYHSNNNKLMHFDYEMKYQLFPSIFEWFWGGLGFTYLSNSKEISGYWTPENFKSLGPRIEMSQHLFNKFYFSGAFNFNYFKENDGPTGDGFYSDLSLQYGSREELNFRFGTTLIRSEQSGSEWTSNLFYLSAHYFI
ncbi:MAG: hypothetical protein H6622_13575 [Halobacteriovoraceae bacterium]|nr:hypothetical protein [Halobacteriovoraceae bacterium]